MRILSLLISCWIGAVPAAPWYPVPVTADGIVNDYQPLQKSTKIWRLCALLPHGKDHYWWGVAWGLSEEAARLGAHIGIYEAGGYEHLVKQRQQLQHCIAKKADALIIAAISARGLETELAQLAALGIPVIDLINGIESEHILSHSVVSFRNMTASAAAFILQKSVGKNIRLGWFPGPEGAGWVKDAEEGLFRQLKGKTVELLHAGYGPTDAFSQASLTRDFYQTHGQVDFILANAVAAKTIVNYQIKQGYTADSVVAFYANPGVIELLQKRQLAAAVTDSPVIQARIAVDLAIRSLEGMSVPHQVSPEIVVLTVDSLADFDISRLLPPDEQWMMRRELLDIVPTAEP